MMPSHPQPSPTDPLLHKRRKGLHRLWHAVGFSLEGLAAAWKETAFRQEALAAMVLLPASFVVGRHWVETAVLGGSVVGVLVVELLNTAVENAIDRFGPEWHALSKRAKDMGSAAVLLSVVWAVVVWAAAIYARIA